MRKKEGNRKSKKISHKKREGGQAKNKEGFSQNLVPGKTPMNRRKSKGKKESNQKNVKQIQVSYGKGKEGKELNRKKGGAWIKPLAPHRRLREH